MTDAHPVEGDVTQEHLPGGPEVPSALGRKVLTFVFIVLLEYFVAPPLFGITNFAGTWSELGNVLFVLLVASLVLFVILPVWSHLRRRMQYRSTRWSFYAILAGAATLGLFVTNTVQILTDVSSRSVVWGTATIYTPLGVWPSVTVYIPGIDLFATLNVETPAIVGLLSLLTAIAFVLGARVPTEPCPVPSARPRGQRALATAVLVPFGFITGCPACVPTYFATFALISPSVAAGLYSALPLAPWIGIAGLFYLFGFWLAVRLIRRGTRKAWGLPGPSGSPEGIP